MCYTMRDRIASKKAERHQDNAVSRQATAPKTADAQPVGHGLHRLLDKLTGKPATRRVEKAMEEA